MCGGDRDNSVGQVVACKEPTDDGNRLFIASGALAVDQDDAVHGMGLFLEWANSYVGPSLVYLVEVTEEKLRGDLVLH